MPLLVGGEEIHDALDRFGSVEGVKSADDKVSGFGGSHGDLHGLTVAEFTNNDDVGILSHALAQSLGEGLGITPNLALFDEGGVVLEGEFDGILEGDDGAGAEFGDPLDEGGEGGGFSRSGDAGDKNEAALEMTDFLYDWVVPERGEVRNFGGDVAIDCFDVLAAEVDVSAEAADVTNLDSVVEFPIFVESGALGLIHGAEDELADLVGVEGEVFECLQDPVDTGGGRGADGEVEIGTAFFDGEVEVVADFAGLVHGDSEG